MDDNHLYCSVVIKKIPNNILNSSVVVPRIPDWINENSRIDVHHIDESEVLGASLSGLTVFRDSIYERKRKSEEKKSKLKRKCIEETSEEDFSGPSLPITDTDSDVATSEGDANERTDDELNVQQSVRNKNDSSSSNGYESGNLSPMKKRRKIVKSNIGKLIPIVQKYETVKDMKARHSHMLLEAKEKYDQVVNKIKEEKKLMNLQISSYEKYKKRQMENCQEGSFSLNLERDLSYLCPLRFCSKIFTSPKGHLFQDHKEDVTTEEEKSIYLKAVINIGRNFKKNFK